MSASRQALPAVLEQAARLTSPALQAIAELERRVVEADGGRLKLESDNLRGRSGDRVEDLFWWARDRDYIVSALLEDLDEVRSDPAG
ncbi:MAG: hypothetical protein WBP81_18570, partial [Solirubrobacteraceae bacterium]